MSFYEQNNKLFYQYANELVRIEPWGKDSVRIRATKQGKLPDENWALNEMPEIIPQINIDEGKAATLTNGKITVRINIRGKISAYNQKGELLLLEYLRVCKDPDGVYCPLKLDAREYKPIIGGDYKIKVRFESIDKNEKIYGMGQYHDSCLDLKGNDLELAQRNSQITIPFMISSMGYGFLWNNPSVGRAVFGKNITTWEASSSKCIDYWITAGDTPAEIEENYASVTGYAPMMPDYAMGFWQCKLRYQTQDELLNVAREYKKRGLPISVIVIDFFHWPYMGDWRFDEEYWYDIEGMVKELKELGIELMVSVWPQVDSRSENFKEMLDNGLLTQTEYGPRLSLDFMGNSIPYDATNPKARDYVWKKIKQNYYDKGIKLFWLDQAEPEIIPYDFENLRYFMGSNLSVGNFFPRLYAKNFYDGLKSEGEKDIITLIRCAWAGSQKYGTLVWSGDVYSSFEVFQNQVRAGLNMGLAGIPWWTTDIGGFEGGNPDDEDFRELLIRWFQYGTFSPVMRLHGNRFPHKPCLGNERGGLCSSGADNEVWSFGDKAYEILKRYMFIRERLFDYIKEQMAEAHEKGTPVMRTLFYQFPKDKTAWEVDDEYMFGGDILVAPIMQKGVREKTIYLPKGKKWVDVWSKQVYDGGEYVNIPVTIENMPLFVTENRKDLADLIAK